MVFLGSGSLRDHHHTAEHEQALPSVIFLEWGSMVGCLDMADSGFFAVLDQLITIQIKWPPSHSLSHQAGSTCKNGWKSIWGPGMLPYKLQVTVFAIWLFSHLYYWLISGAWKACHCEQGFMYMCDLSTTVSFPSNWTWQLVETWVNTLIYACTMTFDEEKLVLHCKSRLNASNRVLSKIVHMFGYNYILTKAVCKQ